jgi:FkbM family methyltransferase
MLKALRERIKRAPVVGPALHQIYLKTFRGEGEVLEITDGVLKGHRWTRFMRTHNDDYLRGSYEPEIQGLLVKYLHSGMTFFDIGANAGFFSLLGAHLVGSAGQVVSFEPHPTTAFQLRQQIEANSLRNVTVEESAVCNKTGFALFSDDTVAVMASLGGAKTASRTIEVRTITLDTAKTFPSTEVIKIDVEGAEIDVLLGAKELIATKRPTLLVEIHSDELAFAYDRLMLDFGYRTLAPDGKEISVAKSGERFVVSVPRH